MGIPREIKVGRQPLDLVVPKSDLDSAGGIYASKNAALLPLRLPR